MKPSSDVAFTTAVKAQQERLGSRNHFAQVEQQGGWATTVTPPLAAFLARARSCYLATANAQGQPYAQHRGGPPGFVRVLGQRQLGIGDFTGNQQYITLGNLSENPRAFLFFMDYTNRQRIKIWGNATIVEDDENLRQSVEVEGYRARAERVIVFDVEAWDRNCPQHIPQMFFTEDVTEEILSLRSRIETLEAENAALKSGAKGA